MHVNVCVSFFVYSRVCAKKQVSLDSSFTEADSRFEFVAVVLLVSLENNRHL